MIRIAFEAKQWAARWCVAALIWCGHVALGDLPSAMKFYEQGQYVEAEREFQELIKIEKKVSQRAHLFKMLGVVFYMQGKRQQAREAFQQGKRLDPSLALGSHEASDTQLRDFFDSIEVSHTQTTSRHPPTSSRHPSTTNSRHPPTTTNSRHPPTKPEGEARQPLTKAHRAVAKGRFSVSTTAKSCSLTIDGFSEAFSCSQVIEISPGIYTVRLTSPGHDSLVERVRVEAGKNTVVRAKFALTRAKTSEPEHAAEHSRHKPKRHKSAREKRHPKKGSEAGRKALTKGSSTYWYPLGLGFFQSGQDDLGWAYASTQVGFLAGAGYFWYAAWKVDSDAQAEVDVRNANAPGAEASAEVRAAYADETNRRSDAAAADAQRLVLYSRLSLLSFVADWGLSVAHRKAQLSSHKLSLTPTFSRGRPAMALRWSRAF